VGVATDIAGRLLDALSPRQICLVCLLITVLVALWAGRTFANDSEVTALRGEVATVRVSLVEKAILDTLAVRCRAADKSFATSRLQALRAEYFQLTRREYPLPTCEEIS
jgi:hypothetical protein